MLISETESSFGLRILRKPRPRTGWSAHRLAFVTDACPCCFRNSECLFGNFTKRDGISDAANEAAKSAGPELQAIQNDLNSLKDTLSRFMSQATTQTVKSARDATSNFAGRLVMSPAISPTVGPGSFLLPGTKQRPSLLSSRPWLVETRSAR
jgi:hypothetical protein